MGKGSHRRPTLVSRAEEDIRYLLAQKRITFEEYEKKMKLLSKGKK